MKAIELTVTVRNNRMKKARLNHGLSQIRLASLTGVTLQRVNELENLHKIKFSTNRCVQENQILALFSHKNKIANALDSTVEEMFPKELSRVKGRRVVREIDVPEAMQLNTNGELLRLKAAEANEFKKMEMGDPQETMGKVLATLSLRERQIIRERFGFESGYPKCLEEVANIFHVTRERVRQIEAKAIRKLRHPLRARPLREYAYP